MIVYKNYVKLMKKQFPIVLIYVAIFMLLIFVLTNSSHGERATGYEQTKVRIAIFDHDEESELVNELLKYLEEYCEIVTIPEKWQDKLEALSYRNVYYIITIPSKFSENFFSDEPYLLEVSSVEKTQETTYINQALGAYIDGIRLYHEMYPEYTVAQLTTLVNEEIHTSVEVMQVGGDSVVKENVDTNAYYNLFGFILSVCIVIVVCTGMSVYRRETIYRLHRVAPISTISVDLQLLLGNLAYIYMYTILFLAVGSIVRNEKDLSIRTLLYWGNTFAFVLSILLFAYFLAYRIKHQRLIPMIANIAGIVLALTSGVFIRQEYLPEGLVKLASLFPIYWYVKGNDIVMKISAYKLTELLPFLAVLGVQVLFALMFFCLTFVGAKLEEVRK